MRKIKYCFVYSVGRVIKMIIPIRNKATNIFLGVYFLKYIRYIDNEKRIKVIMNMFYRVFITSFIEKNPVLFKINSAANILPFAKPILLLALCES